MKILKIFGIVVGIHVFALVLIFANPGCSSSAKPTPAATDTIAKADPAPAPIVVPNTAAPISFNPDAPAMAAPTPVRFTPTRPNTPAASALVAEPVKDVTPMTTYAVKSGDSLWSIANRNKLTPSELATANNLKSNAVLQPGQKLIIPGKTSHAAPTSAATAPATAATTSNVKAADTVPAKAGGLRHTVKSGETLGTIAQKYGVKQRDLAIANNITDPLKLAAGKELVIPGWDPKSPKSATKSPGTTAAKPLPDAASFAPPATDQAPPVISAQPAPAAEVPVIRVEESKKP
ncbi:MAG: LysM peptidoglycan-binding domain-containing protein [Verrucomicrobia bacterium]|nr:LysM peptidoglycan-binding domain-containing protein [Verrucomicrobiota bacterium]